MQVSTDLPTGLTARAVTSDGPLALILVDRDKDRQIHLYTFEHRGHAENAEVWRRIALAAGELAMASDDLAHTAEATA